MFNLFVILNSENQGIKPNKTLNFFSKLHYLFIPHSIPNEFKAEEYEEIIELLNNMGYNTEKLMKEVENSIHIFEKLSKVILL